MKVQDFKTKWGNSELKVEFGKFAQQAHGSCTVQYGDTVVLATAVRSENVRGGIDYFPLMVDYEEKLYAAGKIKGSRFIKREGRPTDEAMLSARLIDRSIRPLFDETVRNDVQVVITVLSFDGEHDPEVPGMLAASLALTTSDIPWKGPIAGVRVGHKEGKFILNPTNSQLDEESDLNLFVAGTPDRVLMIEAKAQEVPEKIIRDAIAFGQKELKPVMKFIADIHKKIGVEKIDIQKENEESKSPEDIEAEKEMERVLEMAQEFVHQNVDKILFDSPKAGKLERRQAFSRLADELDAHFEAQGIEDWNIRNKTKKHIKKMVEAEVTRQILMNDRRVDGRKTTEVRPVISETGLLPRTHGSAHFMRGETQVLSVVTLGPPGDKQILDTMEEDDTKKRFMHHYNFPPYSVGEVKFMRGPGRRDIGHGALAEKALSAVIPPEAKFPYTIRVVSEVLGSNGSSSMASTCGSSLALMNAGVPITKHVAGVAIGLASNADMSQWKVLTDIQDLEDGKGGMDFKITGTEDGITAIQLDTKTDGLTPEIVEQALTQGRDGRLDILKTMKKAISKPGDMSPYSPRIETITIDPDKIRDVIGPGGKIINKIIDETGVDIDIEQDGTVFITSSDGDGMAAAIKMVEEIVKEVEVGEEYEGPVVRIEDFGAFIQILPNKDGMVHVSEISWDHVNKPSDVLKMGQVVKVKVKEIDDRGRVNLSMKALLEKPEGWTPPPPRERNGRTSGARFGNRGGGGRGPRGPRR